MTDIEYHFYFKGLTDTPIIKTWAFERDFLENYQ